MKLISDHTFGGSRFKEFSHGEAMVSFMENWAGKRLLAFSPAQPPPFQREVATKLGIDLSKPHKAFSARGTDFYIQSAENCRTVA